MCMVNLLVIPQRIVVFFYYMIDFSSDVSKEKFCFVKRAQKSKCRHYRYSGRSIYVKL